MEYSAKSGRPCRYPPTFFAVLSWLHLALSSQIVPPPPSPEIPLVNFSSAALNFEPNHFDQKGVLQFMLEQAGVLGMPDVSVSDAQFGRVKTLKLKDKKDKVRKSKSGRELEEVDKIALSASSDLTLGDLRVEWSDHSRVLRGDIEDILLDIEGAFDKASDIRSCRTHLEGSLTHLKRAGRALGRNEPDFLTAKVRVGRARDEISRCIRAIDESQSSRNYYGQAELQRAHEKLRHIYRTVLQLSEHQRVKTLLNGFPLKEEAVSFGGSKVKAKGNNFYVPYNGSRYRGARVKSVSTFRSGLFSAQIKCPRGRSLQGLNTAFYLSTDADDKGRSSIIMEFHGNNHSFVSLSTVRKGKMGATSIVALGYDCSDRAHTYSIAWSDSRIMWRNEKGMLRIINLKWWKELLPQRPMHLFLEVDTVNTVGTFQWPTVLRTKGVDYVAAFEKVTVNSPVDNYYLPPVPSVPPDSPLYPISSDYCLDHMRIRKNEVRVKFDRKGCGGRFRSTINYLYGQFSAEIICPSGNTGGLVSAFYLSTMEGSPTRDEIDFEFLGGYKKKILTNVYIKGVGNQEKVLDLGFDCSSGFHTYTIRYTQDSIVWFIDGKKVRRYDKSKEKQFPNTPMFLYGSVWNASDFLLGKFAGKWNGNGMPYYTTYRNFEISSPWPGKQ